MLCNRELYRLFHSGTIAPREFDIDARYRCVCTCVYVSKIDVVFIHRPALYRRGRAFMSGAMIDRCNANSAHHRAFITSPPPFPLCPFYEIVTSYLREIPLRATLTSRLTISLFIIRGDLEIDEQRNLWILTRVPSGISSLFSSRLIHCPFLKIHSSFIKPKKQRVIELTVSVFSRNDVHTINCTNFSPFLLPNIFQRRKREKRRRRKRKRGLVKKVGTRPTSRYSSFRFKEFPR